MKIDLEKLERMVAKGMSAEALLEALKIDLERHEAKRSKRRPIERDSKQRKRGGNELPSGGQQVDDPRTRLFRDGLSKLAMLTGKGPDSCRSFLGKCLKAADDNAIVVLGLIEDAERNRAADPASYIAARLKSRESGNGKTTVHDAAKELTRRLEELDEPAPSGLREQESGSVVRLLSPR